jgi:UDP-glucose:(heptosyl)LPS alpha-1,3-glucosyltransferase
MKVAFCYESVVPARGGCETYIADLSRRLLADGHQVHLYACNWDAEALPAGIRYHVLPRRRVPRFLRPWRFSALCRQALAEGDHDVSIGFDKVWGTDVLYPQGGLHVASVAYNLHKHPGKLQRGLAYLCRRFDLAHWSFTLLERKQYLHEPRPLILVNSCLVRRHFREYYGLPEDDILVVHSAIDPQRLADPDRPRRRLEWRARWGLAPAHTVGLFAAMNYRLKGLEPLLHSVRRLTQEARFQPAAEGFRLMVAGNPDYRRYQRLARKLGIADRVIFVSHCADMRNCYFASDFVVQPTFYDTCSLVVLEGLACGLPVITTRSSGASEFLHPLQEGYVLDDPHDHGHLAWCMSQLLDPARRLACGQAARRTAAQWTFEHHYRQLLRGLSLAAERRRAA